MSNNTEERAIPVRSWQRLRRIILNFIADYVPMSMGIRAKLYKLIGVRLGTGNLLGKIIIDRIYPENISIGNGCTITQGCVLLSHFYDVNNINEHAYYRGNIKIGNYCYIGMNTVFTRPVSIGDGVVIGAGSVVNKDIPPYQVWAGVPARFIRNRYEGDKCPHLSPDEFKSK